MGHRAHPQHSAHNGQKSASRGSDGGRAHATQQQREANKPSAPKQSTEAASSGVRPAIEGAIEGARERVGDALEGLQEKLDPTALKAELGAMKDSIVAEIKADLERAEDVVDDVQGRAKRVGESLFATLKENPIPIAMAGVGLTWLLASALTSSSDTRMPRRGGDGVDAPDDMRQPGQAIGRVMHQAGDKLGGVTRSVKESGDEVARQTAELAQQVQSSLGGFTHAAGERVNGFAKAAKARGVELEGRIEAGYRDNPLLIGAAAAAAGITLGLAIPLSAREDRMIGGVREGLRNSARSFAEDTVGKVQGVAKRIGSIAGHGSEAEDK